MSRWDLLLLVTTITAGVMVLGGPAVAHVHAWQAAFGVLLAACFVALAYEGREPDIPD